MRYYNGSRWTMVAYLLNKAYIFGHTIHTHHTNNIIHTHVDYKVYICIERLHLLLLFFRIFFFLEIKPLICTKTAQYAACYIHTEQRLAQGFAPHCYFRIPSVPRLIVNAILHLIKHKKCLKHNIRNKYTCIFIRNSR